MVSSTKSSPFSTKQLLVTALVALAAGSTQAAGAKNATSAVNHASFGKITSGSGKCITGDPTTYVTREDMDWVWKNTMTKEVTGFNNLIFDQVVNNKGHLNYCVRWDTNKKLTKAAASKFQAMLERQINVWNRWLAGYNCWPYDKINISVVGFAVRDKYIMDWDDDSPGTIYEGILDNEGSPKCPDECYKHLPAPIPADARRVWVDDMLKDIDQAELYVLLHEMGHGFGLPEMYVDENKPAGFPECVMDMGFEMTDADGWLLRSIYENVKSRYNF
ncbi:hypothetical protein PR003_g30203 [Phytophthora rubi]|uniref:Peptidase M10 metallopeptidase domain-containing protein n=1 Tax=Phytophthora rubi TaxID=129364 RepID=A0A6A4BGA5_9STRA|nr:hypothetical protein PR003_g30203 [Phytophthora rubi]